MTTPHPRTTVATAPLEEATQLREAFVNGTRSPVDYLQELVQRAEAWEPRINAFTQTRFDEANAQAQRAETLYRDAAHDLEAKQLVAAQPLLGIPVALKEKHALAGEPLSFGFRDLQHQNAQTDSTVTHDITRAGGIIHARTTSPEFSCATFTHSPLWGVTRNPWDEGTSPGGSSGGAGAALAAGLTPLATASDIAGSTRIPAAYCGVVGYKAPYGRIAGEPPLSLDWYRGDGPMARSVADVALLTNVMQGQHARDTASIPAPVSPLRAHALDPTAALHGKRVALSLRLGDYPVEPHILDSLRTVADMLSDAGAIVEEVELPWRSEQVWETAFAHYGHLLAPAMRAQTQDFTAGVADYTEQFMRDCEAVARRVSFHDGLMREAALHADLAELFDGVDVLLAPTNAVTSLDADGTYLDGITSHTADGPVHLEHYWQGHMTIPFNIANRHPVLNIPAPATPAGYPVGLQIVGAAFAEQDVFTVGACLEALLDWNRAGYPDLPLG